MHSIISARQNEKSEMPREAAKILVELLREINNFDVSDFGDNPLETDALFKFNERILRPEKKLELN